jgi:hypothetical protein
MPFCQLVSLSLFAVNKKKVVFLEKAGGTDLMS